MHNCSVVTAKFAHMGIGCSDKSGVLRNLFGTQLFFVCKKDFRMMSSSSLRTREHADKTCTFPQKSLLLNALAWPGVGVSGYELVTRPGRFSKYIQEIRRPK